MRRDRFRLLTLAIFSLAVAAIDRDLRELLARHPDLADSLGRPGRSSSSGWSPSR